MKALHRRGPNGAQVTPPLWRLFFALFALQAPVLAWRYPEEWSGRNVGALIVGAAIAGFVLRGQRSWTAAAISAIALTFVGLAVGKLAGAPDGLILGPAYGAAAAIATLPPYVPDTKTAADGEKRSAGARAMLFGLTCLLAALGMVVAPKVLHQWRTVVVGLIVVSGLPWLVETRRARHRQPP